MMAMNVISWLVGVDVEFNSIVKIRKYRQFHEGHHFILMTMEVHDAFGHDMDHFIKECARLFHDRQSKGNLSLFFSFNFSSNVLILIFNVP
jgi:hypothetical protein